MLLATLLVVAGLVPALDALQAGLRGAGIHQARVVAHLRLTSKLEEVLAKPFTELLSASDTAAGNPSSYSDPAGAPARRLVILSGYDADNADGDDDPSSGTDPGLLTVRVEIEATPHSLTTLTRQ